MKRILLFALALMAVMPEAKAQGIDDRAAYFFNTDTDLWYSSRNAAGLAHSDMALWRNVALGYDMQSGKFKDAWGAQSQSSLSLGGDMLMDIEGFKVAAALNLERNRLSKSRYNTSLYEVSWDMPYYVALNSDDPFGWKQSHANVDVSAATPLILDDMLSLGVNFGLDMKGASKNVTPKCRYRALELGIMPSATFAIDEENIAGLSVGYKFCPSRSALSVSDGSFEVAFLDGLGHFLTDWVGGDFGLKPVSYTAGALALAAEYSHLGDASDWLLELTFDKWRTTVEEDEALRGTVDKFVTGFTAKGLFGEARSRKLTFGLQHNLNYWMDGVNARTKGANNQLDAILDYTAYTGADKKGEAFDWTFGLGTEFHMLSYKRIVPDGKFSVVNALPYAFIGKNILLAQEQSLLARLGLGYNFSAGSKYSYDSESDTTGNYIVNYMYDDEVDYLGSYYLRTTLSADYTYRLNTMLAPYASLGMGVLTPMGGASGSRFIMSFKVGVLF